MRHHLLKMSSLCAIVLSAGCGASWLESPKVPASKGESPSVPGAASPTAPTSLALSGRVTSFDGKPLAGAEVVLLDRHFQPISKTQSDGEGRYVIEHTGSDPFALAIVKGYRETNLEFWGWNLPTGGKYQIDARIDRLELYGVHIWEVPGAGPTLSVYFRPMSLTRVKAAGFIDDPSKRKGDIASAPKLHQGDLSMVIDGSPARVLRIDPIREELGDGRGTTLGAYIAQVERPKTFSRSALHTIVVTASDRQSGEKGEAMIFYEPR